MNKIDIDKFICSMIEHQMDGSIYKNQLLDSLKQQGITYKDGELQKLSNVEKTRKNSKKELKFKVGQTIREGGCMGGFVATVVEISEDGYHCDNAFVPFTAQDKWEIVNDGSVNIDAMIDAYEKRLVSQANGVAGSPLVTMCLTSYKHGLQDAISEQKLANSCESCKDSQRIVSAKAKEKVYSGADLTEFELKLKELFDLTAFAAHDTGKTLIEIARRMIVDEIDKDTINEMVGDRAEHCGNPCTLYYEGSVKNYRKGILDTLELIKKG